MAEGTVREFMSITLAITCCARCASTPARVPSLVMAKISSLVMRSSRTAGRRKILTTALASQSNSHTSGFKTNMHHSMGCSRRTARASGLAMLTRLGSRSANKINSEVTATNDSKNPVVCAGRCGSHSATTSVR